MFFSFIVAAVLGAFSAATCDCPCCPDCGAECCCPLCDCCGG